LSWEMDIELVGVSKPWLRGWLLAGWKSAIGAAAAMAALAARAVVSHRHAASDVGVSFGVSVCFVTHSCCLGSLRTPVVSVRSVFDRRAVGDDLRCLSSLIKCT